jgi:hypothetical protein
MEAPLFLHRNRARKNTAKDEVGRAGFPARFLKTSRVGTDFRVAPIAKP